LERFGIREVVASGDARTLRRLVRGRVVYLASASPRRRALLSVCGVRYRMLRQTLDEPEPTGPDWRRWVRTWSLRKARDAAGRVGRGLVIGADTIVVAGRCAYGKPDNGRVAATILRRLSGRRHQVMTGVAVVDAASGHAATGSEVTAVTFRTVTRAEIDDYVASGEPMDKAGAYAIQGGARAFVTRCDGPLDNVIGFPIGCLVRVAARVVL